MLIVFYYIVVALPAQPGIVTVVPLRAAADSFNIQDDEVAETNLDEDRVNENEDQYIEILPANTYDDAALLEPEASAVSPCDPQPEVVNAIAEEAANEDFVDLTRASPVYEPASPTSSRFTIRMISSTLTTVSSAVFVPQADSSSGPIIVELPAEPEVHHSPPYVDASASPPRESHDASTDQDTVTKAVVETVVDQEGDEPQTN